MPLNRSNYIGIESSTAFPYIFDVTLHHLDLCKQYHSVECHLVLYPYSRKVDSDDIAFNPFEEYVKDLAMHKKSVYVPINDSFNKVFGILLGVLICLVFLYFKPSDLVSVESVVSIIGAYLAGKEVWDDLEIWLVRLTKNSRLRYIEPYYSFRIEPNTTLTAYANFAKRQRYGKAPLLPSEMDFLKQSNSQTVRLLFSHKDLESLDETSAHIASIFIKPHLLSDFEQTGYLLGIKLSFNQRKSFFRTKHLELFQSIHNQQHGCINDTQKWVPDAVFCRHTYTIGRWKFFSSTQTINNYSLLTNNKSHTQP